MPSNRVPELINEIQMKNPSLRNSFFKIINRENILGKK